MFDVNVLGVLTLLKPPCAVCRGRDRDTWSLFRASPLAAFPARKLPSTRQPNMPSPPSWRA